MDQRYHVQCLLTKKKSRLHCPEWEFNKEIQLAFPEEAACDRVAPRLETEVIPETLVTFLQNFVPGQHLFFLRRREKTKRTETSEYPKVV